VIKIVQGKSQKNNNGTRPSDELDSPNTTKNVTTRTRRDDNTRNGVHRIPESFSAFCSIVSFTAAKTSRIFVVSVACVRLGSELAAASKAIEGRRQDVLRIHA